MCVRKFIPIVSDAAVAALCTFMLAFTFVRYHSATHTALSPHCLRRLPRGTLVFLYKGRKRKRALDTAAMSAGSRKTCRTPCAARAGGVGGRCLRGALTEPRRTAALPRRTGAYIFAASRPSPPTGNALLTAHKAQDGKEKTLRLLHRHAGVRAACGGSRHRTDMRRRDLRAAEREGRAAGKISARKAEERHVFKNKGRIFAQAVPCRRSGRARPCCSFPTSPFIPYITSFRDRCCLSRCAAAAIFGKRAK